MNDPTPHVTASPFSRVGLGRFISLRTKFVVFFSLIIILTCSGSWISRSAAPYCSRLACCNASLPVAALWTA